jgi:energy-coupling factor transporter ATPase
MTEPLIRAENLHFTYNEGTSRARPALRDIDLEIRSGEYVAVIGHNGSGKSTLARQFNALLLPTEGDLWVKGMNTRDPANRPDIHRIVSMVFQNPDNQIVATVVEEDVAFGPENLGVPEQELHRRVDWALETVGLGKLRHRPPHHLSAGQKQRLAIAGALAMQPECLILDEATSMLDPAGRRAIARLVRQLNAQGITIVTITQSMAEASEADRIIVLAEGQIAMAGHPKQIFADKATLHALGLALPPIANLASLLRARVPDFPSDLLTPAELVSAVKERALLQGGAG